MQNVVEVYIKDRKNGLFVVALAKPIKKTDLTVLRRRGWNFNFLQLLSSGYILYKIVYNGQLQGIVAFIDDPDMEAVRVANVESAPHNIGSTSEHYAVGAALFSIACWYSFQCGEEGYIFFEAKTELVKHYRHILGAKLIRPPQGMGIFPEQSRKLVESFVKEGMNTC